MHPVSADWRFLGVCERELGYGYLHFIIPVSEVPYPIHFLLIANSDIPLVLLAYGGWKLYKRTKFVPLDEIPIRDALDEMSRSPEEKIPRARGLQKLNILWG